jgi:hypothetical protein
LTDVLARGIGPFQGFLQHVDQLNGVGAVLPLLR